MTTTIDSLPPPARTASRPSVSYREYVKDYAKMAAWYVILATGGIASISGAIVYEISGLLMVLTIATGLAIALGGLAGFAAAATAHNSYTKLLALSTVTTYQAPPPVETVRPFVASRNAPRTVRAGRIALPASTWAALFETATDDGRLIRDRAMRVLPRELYRDWSSTAAELGRLGILDQEGKLTAAAWGMLSPHPEVTQAQPFVHSTPAPRTPGAPEVQS